MARRNNNYETKEEKIEITAQYKVNRSDELLNFLLQKCNTSRNNVKNLLSNHQVLVNGSVVTQFNFALAKDDEVKLSKKPVLAPASPKKTTARKAKGNFRIELIYEDDDFIAINKPAGLLSVESDKDRESAYAYVLEYLQLKNKAIRPFIVHRIDKETSGVLIFTKNIKLHSMLKLKWNDYVKTREYVAIVEGKLDEKEKTITNYLFENQNNMMYSSNDSHGQKAITHYKVVKEKGDYSLLNVNIATGRKNQIRVHMNDLGHPIIGDDKYGCNKNPLKRLGLHASKLEFIHPITGELISIKAALPKIFIGLFE